MVLDGPILIIIKLFEEASSSVYGAQQADTIIDLSLFLLCLELFEVVIHWLITLI